MALPNRFRLLAIQQAASPARYISKRGSDGAIANDPQSSVAPAPGVTRAREAREPLGKQAGAGLADELAERQHRRQHRFPRLLS